jgi:hypothetical protein
MEPAETTIEAPRHEPVVSTPSEPTRAQPAAGTEHRSEPSARLQITDSHGNYGPGTPIVNIHDPAALRSDVARVLNTAWQDRRELGIGPESDVNQPTWRIEIDGRSATGTADLAPGASSRLAESTSYGSVWIKPSPHAAEFGGR